MIQTINNTTLVLSLLIGLTQIIGGYIRLYKTKHKSKYSIGLNRYFTLVAGYFLSYFIITIIHNTWIKVDNIQVMFMPILPFCIAIYYWIIIYSYDRSQID